MIGEKEQKRLKIIKVKYQCQGKTFNKKFTLQEDNSYSALSSKIAKGMGLDTDKMYSMVYLDNDKQEIVISNQEDFNIFLQTTNNYSLGVHQTDIPEYSFMEDVLASQEQEAIARQKSQLADMEAYKKQITNNLQEALEKKIVSRTKSIEAQRDSLIAQQKDLIRKIEDSEAKCNKMKADNERNLQTICKLEDKLKNQQSQVEKTKREVLDSLHNFKQKIKLETQRSIKQKMEDYLTQKERDRKKSEFIHERYYCEGDKCNNSRSFIKGVRYECLNCRNFSLCEECETTSSFQHQKTHIFIKIYNEHQKIPPKYDKKSSMETCQVSSGKIREAPTRLQEQIKKERAMSEEDCEKLRQLTKEMGMEFTKMRSLIQKHPNKTIQFYVNLYVQEQYA